MAYSSTSKWPFIGHSANKGTTMSDTRRCTVTAVFEKPMLWLARWEVRLQNDQKHKTVLESWPYGYRRTKLWAAAPKGWTLESQHNLSALKETRQLCQRGATVQRKGRCSRYRQVCLGEVEALEPQWNLRLRSGSSQTREYRVADYRIWTCQENKRRTLNAPSPRLWTNSHPKSLNRSRQFLSE